MVETGHKLGYSRQGETRSHEEFLTLYVGHVSICGLYTCSVFVYMYVAIYSVCVSL